MATTVSHPLPTAQAQAIADLTGYEDAATLRWQQTCVQVTNTLTAFPNGRYVNVRMERMRQGLELAQRGAVTLPDDGQALRAVVRSGNTLYQIDMRLLRCTCADYQKHLQSCKHLLAVEVHLGALGLLAPVPRAACPTAATWPTSSPTAATAKAGNHITTREAHHAQGATPMPSSPVRLPLPPGTTAHQLMAQGMPESSAYRVLKQGWYCPGYNQRDYPQYDGPGGFAHLETPERFVRAYVLRTLAQWEMAPSPDLVADLTQDGLLACWTRRHAPHIHNFPRYYAAMLRGLISQHCQRLQREQQRLRPFEEAGPC